MEPDWWVRVLANFSKPLSEAEFIARVTEWMQNDPILRDLMKQMNPDWLEKASKGGYSSLLSLKEERDFHFQSLLETVEDMGIKINSPQEVIDWAEMAGDKRLFDYLYEERNNLPRRVDVPQDRIPGPSQGGQLDIYDQPPSDDLTLRERMRRSIGPEPEYRGHPNLEGLSQDEQIRIIEEYERGGGRRPPNMNEPLHSAQDLADMRRADDAFMRRALDAAGPDVTDFSQIDPTMLRRMLRGGGQILEHINPVSIAKGTWNAARANPAGFVGGLALEYALLEALQYAMSQQGQEQMQGNIQRQAEQSTERVPSFRRSPMGG